MPTGYVLSQEEHEALSYGLDYHIPSKVTRNSVNTEFESFYQSLLLDISTIPEESIARKKHNYDRHVKNTTALKFLFDIDKELRDFQTTKTLLF